MLVSASSASSRYRMVRRLGQGGMAEVFEAELIGELGFSRRVAIKRMSEEVAGDPAAAARFLEEARIASSLHHAGIVGVLDFGIMEGTPFQVLELVDGLNADQLIDRADARIPTDIALAIAADVAHALHHAHEAGDLAIVHRDVKPSNVLLSWSGDIKLSDFGIAIARGRAVQTETGMAPGSWTFMAPEQRTRSAIDRRADVFALGCTLHALLTGESPQQTFEEAMAVTAGTPLTLAPRFDDDVRAILERALRPAPAERFSTAGELAASLGAALARRLTRDPRSRLQEFLAPLRLAPVARGGLLDQLLAVELVLTSAPGAVRQFELQPPEPRPLGEPSAITAAQPRPVEHAARPSPPSEDLAPPASRPALPPASLRRISAAVAIPLAIAAVGWRLYPRDAPGESTQLASSAPAPAPALTEPSAAPPAPAVRLPDTSPVASTPDAGALPDRAPDAALAPHSAAPSAAAPASTAKRPRNTSATAASAPPPPPAPSTPGSPAPATAAAADADAPIGYLKVVARDRKDARMINARIYVDGKLRGYAPDPISASVGPHQIRVVLEDDRTEIGVYRVEVKADHRDRGHPATLLVP